MANIETAEIRSQKLRELVNKNITQISNEIHERYEIGNEENVLYFHSRPHTVGVVNRANRITNAVHIVLPLEVSEEDIQASRLSASEHDIEQKWKIIEGVIKDSTGKERRILIRQRATGQNEIDSANRAKDFINNNLLNVLSEPKKFIQNVEEGILLTTPDWDKQHQTVIQLSFADKPFVAQAVALADLAGSGMDGTEVALYEAVTLFWEDFIDARRYRDELAGNLTRRSIRVDEEQFYHQQVLDWLVRQVRFIEGRQVLIQGEIDSLNISQSGKTAVRSLFSNEKFEESIAALSMFRDEIANMPNFSDWSRKLDEIVSKVPSALFILQ